MSEISFDDLKEETKIKIHKVQVYEQNLQRILLEKNSILIEIKELENALLELEKTDGDVFKILAGQYMVKSSKNFLIEEIKNKKEAFSLKLQDLEKEEKDYSKEIEKLRKEIIREINNTKI